jgi:hypothetical protein
MIEHTTNKDEEFSFSDGAIELLNSLKENLLITPKEFECNGCRCFYYFEYYPKRYEVESIYLKYRKVIYDFTNSLLLVEMPTALAQSFDSLNLCNPRESWYITKVPGKVDYCSHHIYEFFCANYSKVSRIQNGYDLIEVKEMNNLPVSDKIPLLDRLDFKDILGKRIILFQDCYRTGASFTLVSNKLRSLGVREVVGLFVSKTFWIPDFVL